MKRIIQGKVYNTDTANRIGSHVHSHQGDFHFENTDLYKTQKGAWFICGEGGPYSRWSREISSNGLSGGSGIEAMTTTEALAWCEAAGIDADAIASHFLVVEA